MPCFSPCNFTVQYSFPTLQRTQSTGFSATQVAARNADTFAGLMLDTPSHSFHRRTQFTGFSAAEVAATYDDAFAALHREHTRRARQGTHGVGR